MEVCEGEYSQIVATGAVGIQLVIELLKSEKWEKVLTLTRCFVLLTYNLDVIMNCLKIVV